MGGVVSAIFGGGKKESPAPPPPAPTVDNSQAKLDAAAQSQREAAMRGRSSTILTGGSGLSESGDTSSKKLLGM